MDPKFPPPLATLLPPPSFPPQVWLQINFPPTFWNLDVMDRPSQQIWRGNSPNFPSKTVISPPNGPNFGPQQACWGFSRVEYPVGRKLFGKDLGVSEIV